MKVLKAIGGATLVLVFTAAIIAAFGGLIWLMTLVFPKHVAMFIGVILFVYTILTPMIYNEMEWIR